MIDVLAPDNVAKRAQLMLGSGRTIEAPGTSQAFHRSGIVSVDLDGATARIRRPDLVGALLGKAAAVVKISSQSALLGRGKTDSCLLGSVLTTIERDLATGVG